MYVRSVTARSKAVGGSTWAVLTSLQSTSVHDGALSPVDETLPSGVAASCPPNTTTLRSSSLAISSCMSMMASIGEEGLPVDTRHLHVVSSCRGARLEMSCVKAMDSPKQRAR